MWRCAVWYYRFQLMTLQNFFFLKCKIELLSCPDQKALEKDVLNHSHLEGNIFSMFKVASLVLWGFLLRACLSLKRFSVVHCWQTAWGERAYTRKSSFSIPAWSQPPKQNRAALVEKIGIFSGFFLLWRVVIPQSALPLLPAWWRYGCEILKYRLVVIKVKLFI